MSRRIDTGEPGEHALLLGKKRGDDYLGRLAKYIPAEIVGLYLATSDMVPLDAGAARCLALWVIFGICWVLVPVYFWFAITRGGRKPLWPQIFFGSVAFPVWVFAIGGPFQFVSWYQGWIASITLMFVTVGFGLYKPKPGT